MKQFTHKGVEITIDTEGQFRAQVGDTRIRQRSLGEAKLAIEEALRVERRNQGSVRCFHLKSLDRAEAFTEFEFRGFHGQHGAILATIDGQKTSLDHRGGDWLLRPDAAEQVRQQVEDFIAQRDGLRRRAKEIQDVLSMVGVKLPGGYRLADHEIDNVWNTLRGEPAEAGADR